MADTNAPNVIGDTEAQVPQTEAGADRAVDIPEGAAAPPPKVGFFDHFSVLHLISSLIPLALVVLNWVAWALADEECDTSPLPMKTVFLVFGIFGACTILLGVIAAVLVLVVAKQQAKELAAEVPPQEGTVKSLLKVYSLLGCTGCLLGVASLVFGIMGFIAAINAGSDDMDAKCDDEPTWYWALLIANIVTSCCCSCGRVAGKGRK